MVSISSYSGKSGFKRIFYKPPQYVNLICSQTRVINTTLSYTEGIEILYSSNTIHIRSIILLRHLPVLLPPQRLASITSLELRLKMALSCPLRPQEDQEIGWPAYEAVVSLLGSAFPALRELDILVEAGSLYSDPTSFYSQAKEDRILAPLDGIVEKLALNCQVAFAWCAISEYLPTFAWREWCWRPVTVEQGEEGSGGEIGYWVRHGKDPTGRIPTYAPKPYMWQWLS